MQDFEVIKKIFYEHREKFIDELYKSSFFRKIFLKIPPELIEDEPSKRQNIYRKRLITATLILLLALLFALIVLVSLALQLKHISTHFPQKRLLLVAVGFFILFITTFVYYKMKELMIESKKAIEILENSSIDPDLDPFRLNVILQVVKHYFSVN